MLRSIEAEWNLEVSINDVGHNLLNSISYPQAVSDRVVHELRVEEQSQ